MIAGIAVQMISSRVLPWIGGPSSSSSPGFIRKRQTQYRTTTVDEHEDRHGEDQQDVVERVDLARPASLPWAGNQSISRPSGDADDRGDQPDRQQLRNATVLPRRLLAAVSSRSVAISSRDPWTRQITEVADERTDRPPGRGAPGAGSGGERRGGRAMPRRAR